MGRLLGVSIILIWSMACGDRGHEAFENQHVELLKLGKRVANAGVSSGNASFRLAPNSEIVASQSDPEAGYVTWLAFDSAKMKSINPEDFIEDAQREVYDRFEWLQVGVGELYPAPNNLIKVSDALMSVNFLRKIDGIKLRDAFVEVIYSRSHDGLYKLREIVNHSFGHVMVENLGDPLDVDAFLLEEGYQASTISQEDLILPVFDSQIGYRFYHSRAATVEFEDEKIYTLTFPFGMREPLEAFPHHYHLRGQLMGRAYNLNYLERSTKPFRLPLTDFAIDQDVFQTDIDGEFDIEIATDVLVGLSGPRVNVFDNQTSQLITINSRLDEGSVILGDTPAEIKALNAYTSVHRINAFTRTALSESEVPFLGNPANVILNVDGTCNAFYDTRQNSLNFFVEGDGCADTALINDVIYHEWGHGLDFFTGRQGGITDGAFSEGIGDILATYYTNSSLLAAGFPLNQNQGIRNVSNTNRFPDDQGEVHFEGLIIGGAFWDLRLALQEKFGIERGSAKASDLFLRHLLTADSYRESYLAVLRLDDNDGNPATPSPNHCLINKAFAIHGLAEDEGCTDDPLPFYPEVLDLKAGLQSFQDGQSSWMAAAIRGPDEGFADVAICLGDIDQCYHGEKIAVILAFEGVTPGGKFIYSSDEKIEVGEFSTLTFMPRDDSGSILGYRSIKLVTK